MDASNESHHNPRNDTTHKTTHRSDSSDGNCDDNCDSVISDDTCTSDKVILSNDDISDESNAFDNSYVTTDLKFYVADCSSGTGTAPIINPQGNITWDSKEILDIGERRVSGEFNVEGLMDITQENNIERIAMGSLSESLNNVLMHRTSSDEDCKHFDHKQYQVKDFEFLVNEPVRRSRSLKTNITPPGTPSRKKAVRFADALGLDLESVKTIMNMDNPPKIPASATRDLVVKTTDFLLPAPVQCHMKACFLQPGCQPNFLTRVQEGKVCLENCMVDKMTISGTVRVANISFHKRVVIRYTFNNWITHSEINLSYVQNSNDGSTDRFSFVFSAPPYFNAGCKVVFCIAYHCEHGCFWDNNYHKNYTLEGYANVESETGGNDHVAFWS